MAREINGFEHMVLGEIKRGNGVTSGDMMKGTIGDRSKELHAASGGQPSEDVRPLDRALQKLRRMGLIHSKRIKKGRMVAAWFPGEKEEF